MSFNKASEELKPEQTTTSFGLKAPNAIPNQKAGPDATGNSVQFMKYFENTSDGSDDGQEEPEKVVPCQYSQK